MAGMSIKQIQNLLQYLGYYKGIPDGVDGPLTRQATTAFQSDYKGLTVDGDPGEQTQKALRDAVAYGMPAYEAGDKPESGDFWDDIEFFTREEFKCSCKGRHCDGFPVEPDKELARKLDAIRKHYGVAFTPNSAIRCAKRNAEIPDSSPNSQHITGKAADISVPGVSPKELYAYAESLMPNTGGIGLYSWGIHIDTRPVKARWKG